MISILNCCLIAATFCTKCITANMFLVEFCWFFGWISFFRYCYCCSWFRRFFLPANFPHITQLTITNCNFFWRLMLCSQLTLPFGKLNSHVITCICTWMNFIENELSVNQMKYRIANLPKWMILLIGHFSQWPHRKNDQHLN